MSLDVYLFARDPHPAPYGSGIFVRQGGQTMEITREEWDRAFPGREPVVAQSEEGEEAIFSANITHNLGRMASEAGIYEALWRPREFLARTLAPEKLAALREQEAAHNYHGSGGSYEIEQSLPTPHARDLVEPLRAGLKLLEDFPPRFMALNPENGWGSYEGFVPWVRRYLRACEENPDAEVRASR